MPYLLLQFVFSLRKRSFGLFLIRIQIQNLDPDSNPDPKPDPNPKLTKCRIRIRNRIRNKSFGSATLCTVHYSPVRYGEKLLPCLAVFVPCGGLSARSYQNHTPGCKNKERKKKWVYIDQLPLKRISTRRPILYCLRFSLDSRIQ
jgi:hypothetical protein